MITGQLILFHEKGESMFSALKYALGDHGKKASRTKVSKKFTRHPAGWLNDL